MLVHVLVLVFIVFLFTFSDVMMISQLLRVKGEGSGARKGQKKNLKTGGGLGARSELSMDFWKFVCIG